eukprot:jgi/Antlo1/398/886
MVNQLMQKARNAFHRSCAENVYLRTEEVKSIKDFLSSKQNVLHVCGNPGTGKTFVVLNTVPSALRTYLNFFNTSNIFAKVRLSKKPYFVVDEFDKYEAERKNESRKLLLYVIHNNKKLISISNSLNRDGNILLFKPYSPEEIEKIVVLKLENEVGSRLLDTCTIKYLAKKCSSGDLRQVYERCMAAITKKDRDFEEDAENRPNMQKTIIKELVRDISAKNKDKVYAKYLERCQEIGIPAFERGDFSHLYDLCNE